MVAKKPTKKKVAPKDNTITVTKDYLDAHPEIAEQGVEVGDLIEVQEVPEEIKAPVNPTPSKTHDADEIVWYRVQLQDADKGVIERIFSKELHGERVHSSVQICLDRYHGEILEKKTQEELDNS